MLQDQYRESSKIENEYKKLLTAWDQELSNNPPTDIKKSKINKAEHIQFTLMHLFNGYLDQIWTDSQNMLQCAQAWTQTMTDIYPKDAIFTMNILGLHLMKQSLRTRQEFFCIVDELNGGGNNDSWSSDSTLSQGLLTHHQQDEQHQKGFGDYFDQQVATSSSLLSFDSNNRLTSSPTISQIGSDITSCSRKFMPARNDTDSHKLSCNFCQETLIKKSFSIDSSLQQTTTYDDEDTFKGCNSSFEIASFYYNSESEEGIMELELLLGKEEGIKGKRYKLLLVDENQLEGSLKVELSDDYYYNASASSSSTDTSKQFNTTIRQNCQQLVHERLSSSSYLPQSTCYSEEEEENNGGFDLEPPSIQTNVKTTTSAHKAKEEGGNILKNLSGLLHKKTMSSIIQEKSSNRRKVDMSSSIIRSFSSKKINLCNFFSPKRKANCKTHPIIDK